MQVIFFFLCQVEDLVTFLMMIQNNGAYMQILLAALGGLSLMDIIDK